MINSVIEAVSSALYAEFGYKVHMEEIRQGLNGPCFFIACPQPLIQPFPGNRYFRENHMIVQYFPDSRTDWNRECHDIAERLYWCLEWITMRGETRPVRGTEMSHEIEDGVLQFLVSYNFFVRKTEQEIEMETMIEKQNVKEGD